MEAPRRAAEPRGVRGRGASAAGTVVLHAVPAPHPRFDAEACFREMVADLARGRFGGWANRLERFAATYACRAAVKAGEPLERARDAGAAPPRCSRPSSRRTTCTAAPRSCNFPARSWSAGLAGGRVPVLVGPTAVGKTAVALALAALLPLEVVSADSRQVYRRLDIGTAKPTRKERGAGAAPRRRRGGARCSATAPGAFRPRGGGWVERDSRPRASMPMVVGGTGLYIRALAEGLFVEPALDPTRRRALRALARAAGSRSSWCAGPRRLDPGFAGGGRQRAARAIEIALLTGRPLSLLAAQAARAQGAHRPVVRRAHRAAAGAAPADRAPRARRWCGGA